MKAQTRLYTNTDTDETAKEKKKSIKNRRLALASPCGRSGSREEDCGENTGYRKGKNREERVRNRNAIGHYLPAASL